MRSPRRTLRVLIPLAALAVAACQPDADTPNAPGEGRLNVGVQGLSIGEIEDACYTLTATNGNGATVWTQPGVCADTYGDGTADVTYIGPCDASAPETTVTLVLDELYDAAGDPIPATEYTNPCPPGAPCSQTVNCVENADVPVNFDLTLLVGGDRGFVDVAVYIDYLYCSAKADCVDGSGGVLNLLHNPATGERDQTVVLAIDCRPSACVDPSYFYASDIVVTCDEGVAVVEPSNAGPLTFSPGGLDVFAATLFQGQDALSSGMYHNVAIGIHPGTSCTLSARATASDAPFLGGAVPDGHPYIQWDIPLTDAAGELVCTQHPLHGAGGGVISAYPEPPGVTLPHETVFAAECGGGGGPAQCVVPADCPLGFICLGGLCVEDGPIACDPTCDPGQVCVDGACVVTATNGARFTLQWDAPVDLDLTLALPPGAPTGYVWYQNLIEAGCELDHDDVDGGPNAVENINCQFADPNFITGNYDFYVVNFGEGPNIPYTLSLYVNEVLVNQWVEVAPQVGPPAPPENLHPAGPTHSVTLP